MTYTLILETKNLTRVHRMQDTKYEVVEHGERAAL